MRSKKPDVYEKQEQYRREAYRLASTMKQRHPRLVSLSIDMNFKADEDWKSDPKSQQETYGPDSKAFFEVKCPYHECIRGGFNLMSAVSDMVAKSDVEATGELICQGWQDRERVNKHRCLLKMTYRITASYQANG